MQLFDSLGVDGDGNVVVATLVTGALTRDLARPARCSTRCVLGDPMVTNVCFGGDDLRTAYVDPARRPAASCRVAWPRPGLKLDY